MVTEADHLFPRLCVSSSTIRARGPELFTRTFGRRVLLLWVFGFKLRKSGPISEATVLIWERCQALFYARTNRKSMARLRIYRACSQET